MNKHFKGIICGMVAGIIDVIPMFIQKLSWDANLSAFSLWIVIGYLISISNLKFKKVYQGIFLSFLVLLPCAILIGAKEKKSLIPIFLMTLVLGSMMGFAFGKLVDK